MKRLCIIPCGSKKIWHNHPDIGAVEARNVYTGGFHKACQRYAETFFENWVILSAKHGFLFPSDLVSHQYDVTFKKKSKEVISVDEFIAQAEQTDLFSFNEITVLAGKDYANVVEKVFDSRHILKFPLKGCKGNGLMHQRINHFLEHNREIGEPI
ncbi:DUF6884 domain-containing protein [Brevibacillus sp. NPDC058079]|uniref:DUF6884 domain-containing protein n=1 Tax=Brevibacillus sp. NPDC058079 TaxID=3346330 RepID=UPI0036E6E155